MSMPKLCMTKNTFQATFADEVQAVCSMVTHDDFMQTVTLTHAHVPCVYTARQLAEIQQRMVTRQDI